MNSLPQWHDKGITSLIIRTTLKMPDESQLKVILLQNKKAVGTSPTAF